MLKTFVHIGTIILLGSTLCVADGSAILPSNETCVDLQINLDCEFDCGSVSVNACLANNCDRRIIFKKRFPSINSDTCYS